MKKTLSRLIAFLTLFALVFSLAACNIAPGNTDTDKEKGEIGEAKTFVSIEINPSVELTLDKDGTVASVYGANEDGKVLLWEEELNIVGKDYEAAAEYITKLANELGYIKEGHEIKTSVSSSLASAADTIKEKLNSKIVSTAEGIGLSVTASADVAHSIVRELNRLKERYPDNVGIQDLTPSKYKLVLSATEGGEISVTAAAVMSEAELIEKINDTHSKIESYATDLYKNAKGRAEILYEVAMGIALDGIYTEIYLERLPLIMAEPSYMKTFYYGAVYQAYKSTARTYSSLADIIEFGEEMTNYELSEDVVNTLAAELGITDITPLKNEDGKVTVASAVSYVDKFLEDNDLGDEAEERIDDILNEATDAAEMAAMASGMFGEDLTKLNMRITTIVETLNSTATPILSFLPSDAKAELEACLADLNATREKIGVMLQDGLTEDELATLTEEAEKKADEMKVKIEADLSEEEKAKAEELEERAKIEIEKLRVEFTERLNAAEAEAREEIAKKRNERKEGAK